MPEAPENASPETPKKKILIVDDEATFTRMVRMNLEQTDRFEVREVNRAIKAVVTAKEFKPDLILLDVIMPGLDGGEVAGKIKSDPNLKNTPIVFLTATVSGTDAGKDGPLKSGGDLFLSKPVSLQNLLKTIDDTIAGS